MPSIRHLFSIIFQKHTFEFFIERMGTFIHYENSSNLNNSPGGSAFGMPSSIKWETIHASQQTSYSSSFTIDILDRFNLQAMSIKDYQSIEYFLVETGPLNHIVSKPTQSRSIRDLTQLLGPFEDVVFKNKNAIFSFLIS